MPDDEPWERATPPVVQACDDATLTSRVLDAGLNAEWSTPLHRGGCPALPPGAAPWLCLGPALEPHADGSCDVHCALRHALTRQRRAVYIEAANPLLCRSTDDSDFTPPPPRNPDALFLSEAGVRQFVEARLEMPSPFATLWAREGKCLQARAKQLRRSRSTARRAKLQAETFVPLDRASGGLLQKSVLLARPSPHPAGFVPDVLLSVNLSRFATLLHNHHGDVEPLWVGLACYGYHHAGQRLRKLCDTFTTGYYSSIFHPLSRNDDVVDSRTEPRSCVLHLPHNIVHSNEWGVFLLLKVYRLTTGDDSTLVEDLYSRVSFSKKVDPDVEHLRERAAAVAQTMWVSRTELGWNILTLKPGGSAQSSLLGLDQRRIGVESLYRPVAASNASHLIPESLDKDRAGVGCGFYSVAAVSDPERCFQLFLQRNEVPSRGQPSADSVLERQWSAQQQTSFPVETEIYVDHIQPKAVKPCLRHGTEDTDPVGHGGGGSGGLGKRHCMVGGRLAVACAGRLRNSNAAQGVPHVGMRNDVYLSLASLSLHRCKAVKTAELRTFIVEVSLRRSDRPLDPDSVVHGCFLDKDGRGLVSKQYSGVSHHVRDCSFDDDLVLALPPDAVRCPERHRDLHLLFTVYHISFKRDKKKNAIANVLSRKKAGVAKSTALPTPGLITVGCAVWRLFGAGGVLAPAPPGTGHSQAAPGTPPAVHPALPPGAGVGAAPPPEAGKQSPLLPPSDHPMHEAQRALSVLASGTEWYNKVFEDGQAGYFELFDRLEAKAQAGAKRDTLLDAFWDAGSGAGLAVRAHVNSTFEGVFSTPAHPPTPTPPAPTPTPPPADATPQPPPPHPLTPTAAVLAGLHDTFSLCVRRNGRLRRLYEAATATTPSSPPIPKDLRCEVKDLEQMADGLRNGVERFHAAASSLDAGEFLPRLCVWMDVSLALLCGLEEGRGLLETIRSNPSLSAAAAGAKSQFSAIEVEKALDAAITLLRCAVESTDSRSPAASLSNHTVSRRFSDSTITDDPLADPPPPASPDSPAPASPAATQEEVVDTTSPAAWYAGCLFSNHLAACPTAPAATGPSANGEAAVWRYGLTALTLHLRKRPISAGLGIPRVVRHLFQIILRSLLLDLEAFCRGGGAEGGGGGGVSGEASGEGGAPLQAAQLRQAFDGFDRSSGCLGVLQGFAAAVVQCAAAGNLPDAVPAVWGVVLGDLAAVVPHAALASALPPTPQGGVPAGDSGLQAARAQLAPCHATCLTLSGFLNRVPDFLPFAQGIAVSVRDALQSYVDLVRAEELWKARQGGGGGGGGGYSSSSDFERSRLAAYGAAGVVGQLVALCLGCSEGHAEHAAMLRALLLPVCTELWRVYIGGALKEERHRIAAILTHRSQVLKMKEYARRKSLECDATTPTEAALVFHGNEDNPEVLASTIVAKQTYLAGEREALARMQARDRRALCLFGSTIVTLLECRASCSLTESDHEAMRLLPSVVEVLRSDEHHLRSCDMRHCNAASRTAHPVLASLAAQSCDAPSPLSPNECPESTLGMSTSSSAWEAASTVVDNSASVASVASPTQSQKVQWCALGGSGGRLGYVDDQYFSYDHHQCRRSSTARRDSLPEGDPAITLWQQQIAGHTACVALNCLLDALVCLEEGVPQAAPQGNGEGEDGGDENSASEPDLMSLSLRHPCDTDTDAVCVSLFRCCESIVASHGIHTDEYSVHIKEAALGLMLHAAMSPALAGLMWSTQQHDFIGRLVRGICGMLAVCSRVYRDLAKGQGAACDRCSSTFASGFYFACLESSSAAEMLEQLLVHCVSQGPDAEAVVLSHVLRCVFVTLPEDASLCDALQPPPASPKAAALQDDRAAFLQHLLGAVATIMQNDATRPRVHALCESIRRAVLLKCRRVPDGTDAFASDAQRYIATCEFLVQQRGGHDIALEFFSSVMDACEGGTQDTMLLLHTILSGCALLHARFCGTGLPLAEEVPWDAFCRANEDLRFFEEAARDMELCGSVRCSLHPAVAGRVPAIADVGKQHITQATAIAHETKSPSLEPLKEIATLVEGIVI